MVYRRNSLFKNRGVSPVVGVILMVAVTVILAAVVGQFVLNLADILQQPPQAGVTVTQQYDSFNGNYEVTVLVNSLPNADRVIIQCSADCGSDYSGPQEVAEVGQSASITVADGAEIAILGELGQNNRQVIRTHTVKGN